MTALLLTLLAACIGTGAWLIVREEGRRIDATIRYVLTDLDLDEDER